MLNRLTDEQYKAAEKTLLQYAFDMNDGKAQPGEWREDITEAQEIIRKWGFETDYRFEKGKQVLYIGNVARN